MLIIAGMAFKYVTMSRVTLLLFSRGILDGVSCGSESTVDVGLRITVSPKAGFLRSFQTAEPPAACADRRYRLHSS